MTIVNIKPGAGFSLFEFVIVIVLLSILSVLALGGLFDHVLSKRGQRITIVGATSGDTGGAAIEAMRGRIPLGRVGEVEDTAKACAFLCSGEANYITGEAMNVSGGEEYH